MDWRDSGERGPAWQVPPGTLEQVGPRTYRATFALSTDPDAYGRAMDLAHMVYGWRSTLVEVDGSPERVGGIMAMLFCARALARLLLAARPRDVERSFSG